MTDLQEYAVEWRIPADVCGQDKDVRIGIRPPFSSQPWTGFYVYQHVASNNIHALNHDGTWSYKYADPFDTAEEALKILLETRHKPYGETRDDT